MNDTLKEMNKKLDKIQRSVDKFYDLAKNEEYSEEIIAIYREEGDDKNILRIRCGKKDYIDKLTKDASYLKKYENIANSKKALRYAKSEGILPTKNSVIYNIAKPDERKKIKIFFYRVNKKYLEDK